MDDCAHEDALSNLTDEEVGRLWSGEMGEVLVTCYACGGAVTLVWAEGAPLVAGEMSPDEVSEVMGRLNPPR